MKFSVSESIEHTLSQNNTQPVVLMMLDVIHALGGSCCMGVLAQNTSFESFGNGVWAFEALVFAFH